MCVCVGDIATHQSIPWYGIELCATVAAKIYACLFDRGSTVHLRIPAFPEIFNVFALLSSSLLPHRRQELQQGQRVNQASAVRKRKQPPQKAGLLNRSRDDAVHRCLSSSTHSTHDVRRSRPKPTCYEFANGAVRILPRHCCNSHGCHGTEKHTCALARRFQSSLPWSLVGGLLTIVCSQKAPGGQ